MATLKVYATTQHLHVKMFVHYGKLSTSVEFTGGKLTSNGTTAATYSTSSNTMQRFIEGSQEFKNGTIFLQRTIVDGNIKPNVVRSQKAKPSGTVAEPRVNEVEDGTEGVGTPAESDGNNADGVQKQDEGEDTVKNFERLADAKEWLNSMGASTETIIKKAQAEQIAKGMGYQIVWK